MPGSEEGQSQKYCTNCGAQVRTSNAFCVSCGASLSSGAESSGAADPDPTASRGASSLIDDAKAWFGETKRRLGEALSNGDWHTVRSVLDKVTRWINDLPFIAGVAFVGIILLALSILLSPLVVLIATLVLSISLAVLKTQFWRELGGFRNRVVQIILGGSLLLLILNMCTTPPQTDTTSQEETQFSSPEVLNYEITFEYPENSYFNMDNYSRYPVTVINASVDVPLGTDDEYLETADQVAYEHYDTEGYDVVVLSLREPDDETVLKWITSNTPEGEAATGIYMDEYSYELYE